MRGKRSVLASLSLAALAICSGGCIDGFRLGLQAGVESAVATIIEAIIVDAFQPTAEAE